MLCGYLLARNDATQLLFGLMPDYLILWAEEQANNRLRLLFELLNMECHVHLSPCDITVGKLTDLLLLYVMEQALDCTDPKKLDRLTEASGVPPSP